MDKVFKRRKKALAVGEVLKEIIKELDVLRVVNKEDIESVLERVLPKKLAGHAALQKRLRDKLIIQVDNPTFIYELDKYKEKLLATLQEKKETREIKEIFFRVGRIT